MSSEEKSGYAFSSIDVVAQCLVDQPRTNLFKEAIERVVLPEHTVLDMGTGSGCASDIRCDRCW